MLKHLYKTFLVSILSGSLLMLQTSVAFAEATVTSNTTTTDSTGTITNKKTYHFDKVNDNDMLASITMLAGGFVAARMFKSYSPLTMDVKVAAAGGAAFIAGEVMSSMKFKGKIDEMTIEVEKKTDGSVNEDQLEKLQELKKSYEEAKDATKTKKTLQMVAAAAFGVAGILAITMGTGEKAMEQACNTSLAYATKQLTACSTNAEIPTEAAACGACLPLVQKYQTAFTAYTKGREVAGKPSQGTEATVKYSETEAKNPFGVCTTSTGATVKVVSSSLKSTCVTSAAKLSSNQQAAVPAAVTPANPGGYNDILPKLFNLPVNHYSQNKVIQKKSALVTYLEAFTSVFFPTAQAGMLPFIGLAGGALLAFTGILGTMAIQFDTWMFTPRNRAIVFGALAGLSFMASKSSDNVIKKIDENIKAIDNVIADINKMSKGIKAQNMAQQQVAIQTIDPMSYKNSAIGSNGKTTSTCMTGNSSANCETLDNSVANLPTVANLPDSLNTLSGQILGLGNSLSGSSSLSGSQLATAGSIAGKQNAIAKALKDKQDKYTKITNGAFDAKRDEDKLLKSAAAGIQRELQKNGMSSAGMLASLGASPISSSSPKNEIKPETPAKSPVASANAIDISGDAKKEKDDSMKLEYKDSSGGVSLGAVSSSPSANDYDLKTNEIGQENGPSLFELISARYIKSGYSKLLEEDKPKE